MSDEEGVSTISKMPLIVLYVEKDDLLLNDLSLQCERWFPGEIMLKKFQQPEKALEWLRTEPLKWLSEFKKQKEEERKIQQLVVISAGTLLSSDGMDGIKFLSKAREIMSDFDEPAMYLGGCLYSSFPDLRARAREQGFEVAVKVTSCDETREGDSQKKERLEDFLIHCLGVTGLKTP